MLKLIKKLASKHNLQFGVTSKEKYQEFESLNDRYQFTKSILCFAMPIKKGQRIMASYAMERDYHLELTEKLEVIASELALERYSIAVDNSPINDKICALTAGLGFQGKNSLIITKTGSYVMLGEIITDIEIKDSSCVKKDCGACTLCEDACPVGAIGDVYNKCLAGLLQRKVPMDEETMSKIETIYGCDICQDVCPYNKKVETYVSNRYENIDIFDIMKCNKETFKKYKEYAFYWLGHNVMKRNIIIYAKNKGINIDEYMDFVKSKEPYMMKAIEYYWRR